MSVLSHLITLFPANPASGSDQHTLSAGQSEWIRAQLLRTVTLLALDQHRVEPPESGTARTPGTPGDGNYDNGGNASLDNEKAIDYAKKVRDGLRLMSGS